MKNTLLILLSLSIVLCAVSCVHDVEENRYGIVTYIFKNDSGHSLSIEISKATGAVDKDTQKPISLKKVLFLDVPKGTTAYQDVVEEPSIPVMDFYACSIVFDDGKHLEYSKETINDIVADRTNPLSYMAYEHNLVDSQRTCTFTITESHYQSAE